MTTPQTDQRTILEQRLTTFQQNLYSAAMQLAGNEADAADLVQETMLTALQKADQLRDIDSAEAWMHRILVRKHQGRFRKKRPMQLADSGVALAVDTNAADVTLTEDRREELRKFYIEFSQTLPSHLQRVFKVLCKTEGSRAEATAELNVSRHQLNARIHDIRSRLREFATSRGLRPEYLAGIVLAILFRNESANAQAAETDALANDIANAVNHAAELWHSGSRADAVGEFKTLLQVVESADPQFSHDQLTELRAIVLHNLYINAYEKSRRAEADSYSVRSLSALQLVATRSPHRESTVDLYTSHVDAFSDSWLEEGKMDTMGHHLDSAINLLCRIETSASPSLSERLASLRFTRSLVFASRENVAAAAADAVASHRLNAILRGREDVSITSRDATNAWNACEFLFAAQRFQDAKLMVPHALSLLDKLGKGNSFEASMLHRLFAFNPRAGDELAVQHATKAIDWFLANVDANPGLAPFLEQTLRERRSRYCSQGKLALSARDCINRWLIVQRFQLRPEHTDLEDLTSSVFEAFDVLVDSGACDFAIAAIDACIAALKISPADVDDREVDAVAMVAYLEAKLSPLLVKEDFDSLRACISRIAAIQKRWSTTEELLLPCINALSLLADIEGRTGAIEPVATYREQVARLSWNLSRTNSNGDTVLLRQAYATADAMSAQIIAGNWDRSIVLGRTLVSLKDKLPSQITKSSNLTYGCIASGRIDFARAHILQPNGPDRSAAVDESLTAMRESLDLLRRNLNGAEELVMASGQLFCLAAFSDSRYASSRSVFSHLCMAAEYEFQGKPGHATLVKVSCLAAGVDGALRETLRLYGMHRVNAIEKRDDSLMETLIEVAEISVLVGRKGNAGQLLNCVQRDVSYANSPETLRTKIRHVLELMADDTELHSHFIRRVRFGGMSTLLCIGVVTELPTLRMSRRTAVAATAAAFLRSSR